MVFGSFRLLGLQFRLHCLDFTGSSPSSTLAKGLAMEEDVGRLFRKVPLAHLVMLWSHCLVQLTEILGAYLQSWLEHEKDLQGKANV